MSRKRQGNLADRILEQHPFPGKPVDIRRGVFFVPIAAEVIRSESIYRNQDDIRTGLGILAGTGGQESTQDRCASQKQPDRDLSSSHDRISIGVVRQRDKSGRGRPES